MGTEAAVDVLGPTTFRFAPLAGASTYALFTLPYEDDSYTGTQRYLVNLQEVAVTPSAEGAPGWLAPSKLRVRRARIVSASRTLDLLAPVSRLLEGSATVRLYAAGRTTRFEVPVRAARSEGLAAIRLRGRIPVSQAALGTGIVTIDVPGTKTVRGTSVRLRAASKRADLRVARIALDRAKGLSASGTIARQARGVVRIDMSYQDLTAVPRIWRAKAEIHDGRWNLSANNIPASVRASGGSVSVAYTGYYANRIGGEVLTYRVSPGESRQP
jgi:hypothetical protein